MPSNQFSQVDTRCELALKEFKSNFLVRGCSLYLNFLKLLTIILL